MIIVISDSSGNLISGIEYSSSWYGNSLKESGDGRLKWSILIIPSAMKETGKQLLPERWHARKCEFFIKE